MFRAYSRRRCWHDSRLCAADFLPSQMELGSFEYLGDLLRILERCEVDFLSVSCSGCVVLSIGFLERCAGLVESLSYFASREMSSNASRRAGAA